MNRNPIIPEQQWRRMGYLCPPTRRQLWTHRAEGCCIPCGRNELRKMSGPARKTLQIAAITFTALATIFFVLTYMRH